MSIAWLRRSRRRVLALTWCAAREALRDRDRRVALRSLVRLSPELARNRRRLAPHIETQMRLLEILQRVS